MFFFGFPITSYPLYLMSQALDIPNHMPSQASQIYHPVYSYLNTLNGSNTLSTKKKTLEEHLPFKSQTTQSTSSIQSMLNSLENSRCSLIFHHPTYTTTLIILTNNPFLYLNQFSRPHFTSLTVYKTIPSIPTTTLFLCTCPIFCMSIFTYSHPYNTNQKSFPLR